MRFVKKILDIRRFTLLLEFDGGETRAVDLEPRLLEWGRSPGRFAELLDPLRFAQVQLNREIESICWDNGIDLCPDVLYALSEPSIGLDARPDADRTRSQTTRAKAA